MTLSNTTITWVRYLKWTEARRFVQQFGLTTNEALKFYIIGPLWWESTGDRWIPLKRTSNAECVFMSWYIHIFALLFVTGRRWLDIGNFTQNKQLMWCWCHTSCYYLFRPHYSNVIMSATASHITDTSIVYPTVCSGEDQGKHQNSLSLAFVRGIHRSQVNFPHKRPVKWTQFPVDDVTWAHYFDINHKPDKTKPLKGTYIESRYLQGDKVTQRHH